MRRRTVLKGMMAAGVSSAGRLGAIEAFAPPVRRLVIYVAPDLPPAFRETAANAFLNQPLIRALCDGGAPEFLETQDLQRNHFEQLRFHHAILIGPPGDPVIRAAWQREARVEANGFYIFGFGYLQGDIGYIESDRSPFLHSADVQRAPYETQVITITGSTLAGIRLALDAFLRNSLINGVVASSGWKRQRPTLLDRDPLPAGFATPAAPPRIGGLDLIGWTQASEDEYRGVLADCRSAPEAIWRAKYYSKGLWDSPGAAGSFDNYAAGLHRRAYGNTLWMAQFATEEAAISAAPRIAAAAHLRGSGTDCWAGDQLSYANNMYPGESSTQGSLTLTRKGRSLQLLALQQRSS
jgi:hypothetical protein